MTVIGLLALVVLTIASPTDLNSSGSYEVPLTQPYYPSSADGQEFQVPVNITPNNLVFQFPDWKHDYALQVFLTLATTRAARRYDESRVAGLNRSLRSH
ncbi:hypothetical protein ACEQ8H_000400 [Pleosporales sp. CAS-2024a]